MSGLAWRAPWLDLGVARVFGAITSAVNEAWGVERNRSFWKHRLVSFLMLVAAGRRDDRGAVAGASLSKWPQGSSFGVMLSRFHWMAGTAEH
jgi:hypothetical protein